MTRHSNEQDRGSLIGLAEAGVLARMREVEPQGFDAVVALFGLPGEASGLSAKTQELVSLAIHASASTLNDAGVRRQVERALKAGAEPVEIVEVLVTIAPLGVHTFGVAVPLLMEELREQGRDDETVIPPLSPEAAEMKARFVESRGYWTDQREMLGGLIPEFFASYMRLSMTPAAIGSLDPLTREFVAIGIDCSITHMFTSGLRLHIRNALRLGATREQILGVFQLAAALGADSYLAGMRALLAAQDGSHVEE